MPPKKAAKKAPAKTAKKTATTKTPANGQGRGRKRKLNEDHLVQLVATHLKPQDNVIVHNKIRYETETSYRSQADKVLDFWRKLRDTPGPWRDCPFNINVFRAYITAAAAFQDGQERHGENIRSAIMHLQQSEPEKYAPTGEYWADSLEARMICLAARYNGGVDNREEIRRAMDQELYDAILELIDSGVTPESLAEFGDLKRFRSAIIIGCGGAFRISEIAKIKRTAYNLHTKRITITGNKGQKANNATKKKASYSKLMILPEVIAELEICKKRPGDNEYLFPTPKEGGCWVSSELGPFITAAADHLGWTTQYPHLKFDGVHVMRHGGMQRISTYCTEHKISQEIHDAAMMTSEANEEHYLVPNEDRELIIMASIEEKKRRKNGRWDDETPRAKFRELVNEAKQFDSFIPSSSKMQAEAANADHRSEKVAIVRTETKKKAQAKAKATAKILAHNKKKKR